MMPWPKEKCQSTGTIEILAPYSWVTDQLGGLIHKSHLVA
jgi:hypothetical protein